MKILKDSSLKDAMTGLYNRRFLDEDHATCTIGFRCAMDRVGSPTGFNYGRKKKK